MPGGSRGPRRQRPMRAAAVWLLLLAAPTAAAAAPATAAAAAEASSAAAAGACASRRVARVAVCFYGLNRSLRHTLASIRGHVLQPLREACVQADVFFHTWVGEGDASSLAAAQEELRLLNSSGLRGYAITDQVRWARDADLAQLMGLDKRYAGANMQNMLRQLGSLKLVTQLWQAQASVGGDAYYDAVLYIRPDLKVLDKVDVDQLLALKPSELLTPYWHQWSGLNDRVAFAGVFAAAAFGLRYDAVQRYAAMHFVRSESFLKWALARDATVSLSPLSLRAQRVRATGVVADNDVCLEYCRPDRHKACRGDCRELVPGGLAPPLADWAIRNQKREAGIRNAVRNQIRNGRPRRGPPTER
ncbi:hypothetical protein M885DRAFT_521130 [Pelagophyceae sp. CCMP2097]|nr:hypothetical protein M885DRAFT_521130 [Pelagophyceae sp. CCMP2097]